MVSGESGQAEMPETRDETAREKKSNVNHGAVEPSRDMEGQFQNLD